MRFWGIFLGSFVSGSSMRLNAAVSSRMRFEHLSPARDGNLIRSSSMPFNSSKNGTSLGMNPAFLIASPLPLSNAFFVRDFEGVGEGNLIGFAD